MAEQFYTILTKVGKAKIANNTALGTKVNFSKFQVGDGNGSYYNPTEEQTSLKNKVWEGNISSIIVDEENPNWIVIQVVIPSNIGGFTIREAGIVDDENNLIAVGKYPETYKPVAADGSTKDLIIKMILEVSNAASVALKVDPTVVLATQKDIQVLNNKISNIKVPVSSVNEKKGDVVLCATDIKAKDGTTLEEFKKKTTSGLADMTKQIENIDLNAEKVTLNSNKLKSKNVKDALEEVFMYGNDVKNKVVTAVKAKNNNVTINDDWDSIVNNIKNLNYGLDDDIKELVLTKRLKDPYDTKEFRETLTNAYAILNGKLMFFIGCGYQSDHIILLDEKLNTVKYKRYAIKLDHEYAMYKYTSSPYFVHSSNYAVTLKDKVYVFTGKKKIFTVDSNLNVEEITKNIAIQNKKRYCPVVFNENLYVIGGCGTADTTNICKDVWKFQNNGWTQISSNLPFECTEASYVIFKNELYIICSTIWKTKDCITWTQISSKYTNEGYIQGFSRACVFNNKVYITVNGGSGETIYYTEDFITFKKPKTNTNKWLEIRSVDPSDISHSQFLFNYKNNLLFISKSFTENGSKVYDNSLNKVYHYITK